MDYSPKASAVPKVTKSKSNRSRSRSVKTKSKKKDSKAKISFKGKVVKKKSGTISKVGDYEKVALMFKSKELKNNKYWKISRNAKDTLVSFGRTGHKARKNKKEHKDATKAKEFYKKMISEKTKKGYTIYNEDSLTKEQKFLLRSMSMLS